MSVDEASIGPGPAIDRVGKGDDPSVMDVKVLQPEQILFEGEAVKLIAEAVDGSFALLPRHVDFVAPLVAGIVLILGRDNHETVIGIDEGTLVKCGQDVLISTRKGMIGEDLMALREQVEKAFLTLDEHDKTARTAVARLEAGIIRRFIELEEKP
jgi:F-type H+-transporting ATPase subunit epsilon